MNLGYALYERTQAGYGWTWHAAGLSDALLDDFRYRIAVPDDSNSISSEQLRGGICKFDRVADGVVQDYVVLYRFFDGGSDAGRPNRVVMLTAWTTPEQVAKSPSRYGIVGVLRNRFFEYVVSNARAVGIAPPPFCDSLTADAEFSVGGARRVPAAALMKFIDTGLNDTDNTYYVTIRDNEYSLQLEPSLAFKRQAQERQAYEKQLLAAERLRIEREIQASAAQPKIQVVSGADSSRRRKASDVTGGDLLMKIGISAAALMLCVVVGIGVLGNPGWLGLGQKRLSAEAEAVLLQFKGLEPGEQRVVLRQLSDWCERHEPPEGRQLGPGDQGAVANPQQQSLVPPKQEGRWQITPNAGQATPGSPGVDQVGVPQPPR